MEMLIRNTRLGESFEDVNGKTILTEEGQVRMDIDLGNQSAVMTFCPKTAESLGRALLIAARNGRKIQK